MNYVKTITSDTRHKVFFEEDANFPAFNYDTFIEDGSCNR